MRLQTRSRTRRYGQRCPPDPKAKPTPGDHPIEALFKSPRLPVSGVPSHDLVSVRVATHVAHPGQHRDAVPDRAARLPWRGPRRPIRERGRTGQGSDFEQFGINDCHPGLLESQYLWLALAADFGRKVAMTDAPHNGTMETTTSGPRNKTKYLRRTVRRFSARHVIQDRIAFNNKIRYFRRLGTEHQTIQVWRQRDETSGANLDTNAPSKHRDPAPKGWTTSFNRSATRFMVDNFAPTHPRSCSNRPRPRRTPA